MKTIQEMCKILEMEKAVSAELDTLLGEVDTPAVRILAKKLTICQEWRDARQELKKVLAPDDRGMKMLCAMLIGACYSLEKYEEKGISQEIFADTMKCFPRFVHEHKVSYGVWGFDRDFWTGRQLSLQLFRIGQLEYEKVVQDGKKMLSVHIPSDAVLDREKLTESIRQSAEFFEAYDKDYAAVPYTCTSWLLSPALRELLGEDSKILKFQDMFQITEVDKQNKSFMEWVYKRKDLSPEQLPEDTSLQRNMKAHLLAGGWIGEGTGFLKAIL